jgi:hypothetical protein
VGSGGSGDSDLNGGLEADFAMGHSRKDRELRGGAGLVGVDDDGHGIRAEHERLNAEARAAKDRLGCPTSDVGTRSDHKHAGVALQAGAKGHHVQGPGELLALIALKLNLDDDAEHGFAVDQEDHQVGVQLGGSELSEIGGLDADLAVRGQLEGERPWQSFRRARGSCSCLRCEVSPLQAA